MYTHETICKPEFFYLANEVDRSRFLDLCNNNPSLQKIDTLADQKHELSLVLDPSLISHQSLTNPTLPTVFGGEGVWVYFPWKNTAVRILEKEQYETLRMSRNKNLITKEEQKILENTTIAIAGLNVGNPGAVCLALEGIGTTMKLADFDPLSVSNLNRFRAGLTDLLVNKASLSARQMYEINPYQDITVFENGLTDDNMDAFLSLPKIDLLIEEMDNLKFKIKVREKAKAFKIPVLMVTGNADHVLIDVERYDLEADVPMLGGFLKSEIIDRVNALVPGAGTFRDRIELLQDFMGKEYLEPRLNGSFDEVGKTLASIPQLAESSFLRGAALCHFAKKILLKQDVPSGRYSISLDGVRIEKK